MKRSLLLYLFIISLLMNVFTYAYFSKKAGAEQTMSQSSGKHLKDSLDIVRNQLTDANYFSLEYNQNAQNYFAMNDTKPIDYTKVIPLVSEKLMAFNDDPKGNPYTGQEQMGANKFIINKARILNHRWIVADYSNGNYWGDVLLKYFLNDDGTVSFEIIQSILYQK